MLWDSNSIALADSAKRIFSLSFTGGPSAVQRASISYPPLTELTFVNSHTDPAGVCREVFVNSQALPSQKRSSAAQEPPTRRSDGDGGRTGSFCCALSFPLLFSVEVGTG